MVIFEPLVYVVSFVLKLWHLFFAGVFRLSPSAAWMLAIIFLVVTVRGAIFYFSLQQYISNRKSANLRPKLRALNDKYRSSIDPNAPRYAQWGSAEMRRQEGLSASAVFLPIFIQIPVIIGLVRMMRHMVNAADAPGKPANHDVGFLTSDEVSNFLSASLFGRPLPAYLIMSADRYRALGISPDYLASFIIPAIFIAASFTGINLIISVRRLRRTIDYSNGMAMFIMKFLIFMIFFGPASIVFFGLFGPTAVGLIGYWVCNNFWTVTQSAFLTRYIEKKYPLNDEFKAMQAQQKEQQDLLKADRKAMRGKRRKGMLKSAVAPWRARRLRREFLDDVATAKQQREQQQQAEMAQHIKVARVRWAVTQMRPGAQDNLPSLGGAIPISAGRIGLPNRPAAPTNKPDNDEGNKNKEASEGTAVNVEIVPDEKAEAKQKAKEEKAAKSKKKRAAKNKTPRQPSRKVLVAKYLATSAKDASIAKWQKVTKTEPSQWKRFRD